MKAAKFCGDGYRDRTEVRWSVNSEATYKGLCLVAVVQLSIIQISTLTGWYCLQVVGSFSRVGLSLYTYVPPNQTGMFSDSGALNRAVQRPANAFDAFRRAAEEGLSGIWSGISGTLMDPTQVWHTWNTLIVRGFRVLPFRVASYAGPLE